MMTIQDNSHRIQSEMESARRDIKTDYYQMSFGELINLYKDGDIVLTPAYQRLYRWDDEKKTKFIESILLGIPIPPIFVAQDESGVWDVVDGVQRISTILQLTGDLKGYKPLELTTCKYLPSLEGETWSTLSLDVCRIIKRARLTINIIMTENSIQSQYELFQRLNTGGVHLSDQEIRNCLIIMANPEFHTKIDNFKSNSDFKKITRMSEEKEKQEYRMELILRYLITKNNEINFQDYPSSSHIRDFIDSETLKLVEQTDFDLDKELKLLGNVSSFIVNRFGDDRFKRYDFEKKKYYGPFSLSVYECLLPGLSRNFDKFDNYDKKKIEELLFSAFEDKDFDEATKHGTRAIRRTELLTNLSFKIFC